ncbi:hypothetical protein AB4144_44200, partial [Rhizobiaceae sp. 2RAB30]
MPGDNLNWDGSLRPDALREARDQMKREPARQEPLAPAPSAHDNSDPTRAVRDGGEVVEAIAQANAGATASPPSADSNTKFGPIPDAGGPLIDKAHEQSAGTGSKANGPDRSDKSGGTRSGSSPRRRRTRDFKGFLSSAEFIGQMKPPDHLVKGLILRGSTYTLTGNT